MSLVSPPRGRRGWELGLGVVLLALIALAVELGWEVWQGP